MRNFNTLKCQQGAATLFIAVILLVATTLVSLMTAKTVLQETKMTANNYRTAQAAQAANAAMDYAVSYFKLGSVDQLVNATGVAGSDANVDYVWDANVPTTNACQIATAANTTAFPMTLTVANAQSTLARFYFINTPTYDDDNDGATAEVVNPCDSSPSTFSATDMSQAMVVAQGWSDDCSAMRTISQCVTTASLFGAGGSGPEQPFVSQASVGIAGNAKIINRYSNTSIWTGNDFNVSGASMATYLRPSNTSITDEAFTKEVLMSNDEDVQTQQVSGRNAGAGIDIITGDPTLANKTPTDFFNMFFDPYNAFAGTAKEKIKNLAINAGQMLTGGTDDPNGLSGLIWMDGDTRVNAQTVIGTIDEPAVLIVDGDFDMTGGEVNGVVYIVGDLKIAGNPIVRGSVVSESGESSGAGTLDLVFVPFSENGVGKGYDSSKVGITTVVNGSWRDW